jgi:hypothetical protein
VRRGDVLEAEKEGVLAPLLLLGDSSQRFHHFANERRWTPAQLQPCS